MLKCKEPREKVDRIFNALKGTLKFVKTFLITNFVIINQVLTFFGLKKSHNIGLHYFIIETKNYY
jgi:hypothetical protein